MLDCKKRYNDLYARFKIANDDLKKEYDFLKYIDRHNKLQSAGIFIKGFAIGGGVVGVLCISGFVFYMIKKK